MCLPSHYSETEPEIKKKFDILRQSICERICKPVYPVCDQNKKP